MDATLRVSMILTFPRQARFFHRANPDGSFDSICYPCLATVVARVKETDLEPFERAHVCATNVLEANRQLREMNVGC